MGMIKIINASSPILICIVAVIFNLVASFLARNLNLPLFLDTGGTIFIAMMSGYVPSIAVGFATNFLNSLADESDMYYCSISIFVAVYTTFLARRGYFQNFLKTMFVIPPLALITALLTELIEKFLFCTGVVQAVNEIQMNFAATFLKELADKGLLILVMFIAIKFVPTQVKEFFRELGKKQAPLSPEMKSEVYRRKCPVSSLRTKVLLMLMLSSLFIAASISSITYRIFEQSSFQAHIKIAESLIDIAASEIDPAQVDNYIKFGRDAEGYKEIEKKLYAIKNSNADIKFLYVWKISAEGCRVVFDLDTEDVKASEPGELLENDITYPHMDDLIAGKAVAPVVFDDAHGRLLTIHKPIYDDSGQCVCYAAIDFSLDLISEYGRTFISKVLALFSGCFVFVFIIGLRFVENNIILPVNTMAYCARNFAYDSNELCENNVERIKELKIHTGDEIENLYSALLKTTQDVLIYFEKLRQAKKQVAAMDKLAHRDSLTGLKNKAAYDEMTIVLDEKISGGDADFCIAMVDVNFLKRVNDTYGHERGNDYLINAGKLICSVFGEEHVYRIGGDEFVVVIEGEKVSLCKYFVEQFKAETARKNANKLLKPWEKVSAAVGVAFYKAGVDKTADEVFKRADKEMYDNKLAMKAQRTD